MEAARQSPNELQQLASQLYEEPCCRALSLETKPLSETLQWLTESQGTTGADPEFDESVRRFRAIFHLFLMQLDQAGMSGVDLLASVRLTDYLPAASVAEAPLETTQEATMVGSIVNLVAPTVSAPPAPMEADPFMSPGSTHAREYFELAQHFQNQAPGENISSAQLGRLEALQLCFALEVETQESLQQALAAFWPTRREALKGLLVGPQKEIAAPVLDAWEQALAQAAYWPAGERLPLATFRNSLRYLLASAETPVPVPNLVEAALWTYLFGQDLELSGLWLVNHFNLTSEPRKVQDAFLRLCRCHRLKTLLTHPTATFSNAQKEEVREHVRALFAFWSR